MLKLDKIEKRFNGKPVVDAISLDILEGSVNLFLGASGVGKSTLLRILCGLETADAGSIKINGTLLNKDEQQQSHIVGMVFQQFNLFQHKTVKENITLPLEKVLHKPVAEASEIADELLIRFGLQDLKNTAIDDLSGGQKQRLALARTLAMKPRIICMDEPTSALDPLLTSYVAELINDLAKQGYIVIVATHDTVLIEKIDCVVHLMQQGKIVESVQSIVYRENPNNYPYISNFVAGRRNS